MILLLDCTIDRDPSELASWLKQFTSLSIQIQRPDELPPNLEADWLSPFSHCILSGSRASCLSQDPWVLKTLQVIKRWIQTPKPILGICMGHQLLVRATAENVGKDVFQVLGSGIPEQGLVEVQIHAPGDPVFGDIHTLQAVASHVEEVKELFEPWQGLGSTLNCRLSVLRYSSKWIWGVQFHPERGGLEHFWINSFLSLQPRVNLKVL